MPILFWDFRVNNETPEMNEHFQLIGKSLLCSSICLTIFHDHLYFPLALRSIFFHNWWIFLINFFDSSTPFVKQYCQIISIAIPPSPFIAKGVSTLSFCNWEIQDRITFHWLLVVWVRRWKQILSSFQSEKFAAKHKVRWWSHNESTIEVPFGDQYCVKFTFLDLGQFNKIIVQDSAPKTTWI